MKVFLFGDYDYFVKMYGVSGAHGTHPCLNCKASKAQTEAARGDQQDNFPKRSVENRKKDHQLPPPHPRPSFLFHFFSFQAGLKNNNNKKRRKQNTTITLCSVHCGTLIYHKWCHVPYLHILPGIVKRHHVLIEKECHNLDQKIGKHSANAIMMIETSVEFRKATDYRL